MDKPFSEDHCLTKVVKILLDMFDDQVMIFWICCEFEKFSNEIHKEFPKHLDLFKALLEREDLALFNHFTEHDFFQKLPLETWCANLFAGVLSGPALLRFWDKICGGSRKIVAFILLMLFKTMKKATLESSTVEQIVKLVDKGNHQDDLIVNKAIESWQLSRVESHAEYVAH